jgi:photosystem II stability/assembly factor-like uncharacterized protein
MPHLDPFLSISRTSRIIAVSIASTFAVAVQSVAAASTWQSIGPSAGSVSALLIDPQSPEIAYAVGPASVFKTTNGGRRWSALDPEQLPGPVASFAIAPSDPSRLYAATGDGATYRSDDRGITWTKLGQPDTSRITDLIVDPRSPQTLYGMPGAGGGILKSTDGGSSWRFLGEPNAITLALDPQRPQTLYAGTGNGVLKSTDGGASWSAINAGFKSPAPSVASLVVDPQNDAIVYASTVGATGAGTLYVTRNGGGSWIALPIPGSPRVTSLVIAPGKSEILYAAAGSILRSSNAGRTWQALNGGLGATPIGVLALDPTDPARLFAGVSDPNNVGPAVFKTADSGADWEPFGRGISASVTTALATDSSQPGTVLIGTVEGGVERTLDDGQTWQEANGGLQGVNVRALVADPSSPGRVYTDTNRAFFSSVDDGGSWARPGGRFAGGSILLATQQAPTTLFAVSGQTVFRSADRGAVWDAGYSSPAPVLDLALAPSDANLLYLAANDSALLWVSHDAGTTFQPTTSATLPFESVTAMAVDPHDSNTVYIAGQARTPFPEPLPVDGLWKTEDGGASFVELNTLFAGPVTVLLPDPAATGVIYAAHGFDFLGGGGRVEVSRDGGSTWSDLGAGLPGAPILHLARGGDSTLYAATEGSGVYQLPIN